MWGPEESSIRRVNFFSRILRHRCHFLGRSAKSGLNGLKILSHHSVVAPTNELVLGLAGYRTSRCVLPSVRLHFTSAFQELPRFGMAFGIIFHARVLSQARVAFEDLWGWGGLG
jgi:hypothetical protein